MFLFEPQLAGYFQYDSELGFRVKPYSDGTNQFGFNDIEYGPKPNGTYRILFVGDSFGWTGGINWNYTARIERAFESLFGRHVVDVVNTGYPMTQTAEQLIVLRRYGMQYKPDLVVLGFFCGNDFIDANPYRKRIVLMDTYLDVDRRHEPATLFGRPLVPKSRLLAWTAQRIALVKERFNRDTAEGLSEPAYMAQTGAQINFYNTRRQARHEYDENISMIFDALAKMKALVEGSGARFAVAIFPGDFSVHRERADAVFSWFDMRAPDYDLAFAPKILAQQLAHTRTEFIDLLPGFVRAGGDRELYRKLDNHWNAAGDYLAAELLFDWLRPQVEAALPR